MDFEGKVFTSFLLLSMNFCFFRTFHGLKEIKIDALEVQVDFNTTWKIFQGTLVLRKLPYSL